MPEMWNDKGVTKNNKALTTTGTMSILSAMVA
jgi:hypothetical protein